MGSLAQEKNAFLRGSGFPCFPVYASVRWYGIDAILWRSTFSVTVKAPKGSNLDTVDALSLQVEEILEQIPEMVSMSVTMSGSSGSIMGSSEESSISCVLVDKNKRDRSTDEIVEEVRNSVKNIAGAEISVSSSSSMGSMMGGGVSVEIYGDDMDKL